MKIKNGFIARNVGGKRMVVATGAQSKTFGGVMSLNGSGSLLWDALVECADREALVAKVLDTYDIDRATAEADVDSFIVTLREAGVLDE